MTLSDLLKRVDLEKDIDKVIILECGEGWSNISARLNITDTTIGISEELKPLFNND